MLLPRLFLSRPFQVQIDTDDGGTVDGREAAKLLGKSDLTREQLHAVWEMADVRHAGALDPSEWALAMHLARWGSCGARAKSKGFLS